MTSKGALERIEMEAAWIEMEAARMNRDTRWEKRIQRNGNTGRIKRTREKRYIRNQVRICDTQKIKILKRKQNNNDYFHVNSKNVPEIKSKQHTEMYTMP